MTKHILHHTKQSVTLLQRLLSEIFTVIKFCNKELANYIIFFVTARDVQRFKVYSTEKLNIFIQLQKKKKNIAEEVQWGMLERT
jgi:hypothetical protein